MSNTIELTLAGMTLSCALRFPGTAAYFPKPDPAAPRVGGDPVCLSASDWEYFTGPSVELCPHTEYSFLTSACSEALLDYDRMILHAAALRWRDRAYLICGRSGVGKSTQTRFLQELRPGEFSVICGDRPILEFQTVAPAICRQISPCHSPACRDERSSSVASSACHSERSEGSASPQSLPLQGKLSRPAAVTDEVIVHPSPWNGKENWYGAEAAPLAGLIFLCRGEKNELTALSPREAAIPVYGQVIQLGVAAEKIKRSAALTTRLLNTVPLWQLSSDQVPDSTRLLLETLFPA